MTKKKDAVEAEVVQTKPARMPRSKKVADNMTLATTVEMQPLMTLAIDKGESGVEMLKELLALKERVDKEDARKAWFAAVSQFQSHCPSIKKTKKGQHGKYAPLGKTLALVRPHLSQEGLSATWITRRHDGEPYPYKVCRLAHELGHVEEAECPIIIDDDAGRRNDGADTLNAMQKYGIADSYAERYSFEAVAGIAAEDDGDGNAPDPPSTPMPRRRAPASKPAAKPKPKPKPAAAPAPVCEQCGGEGCYDCTASERPPDGEAQPAQQTETAANVVAVSVVEVETKEGSNAQGPWVLKKAFCGDGRTYRTFSKSHGVILEAAAGTGEILQFAWKEGRYGREIEEILVDEGPDPNDVPL